MSAVILGAVGILLSGGLAAAGDHRITLVTGELKDPFYVTMAAGAKAEAKKLGVTLDWQGPSAWDPSLQIPVFDSVFASKPEFLIAVPDDDKALILPLKKFRGAGIPVLTADTDVADLSVRIGNITSNNTVGGTLSAKTIAEVLGERVKCSCSAIPRGSPRRTIGRWVSRPRSRNTLALSTSARSFTTALTQPTPPGLPTP